jgi:Xaa-Pro aminopeptidase
MKGNREGRRAVQQAGDWNLPSPRSRLEEGALRAATVSIATFMAALAICAVAAAYRPDPPRLFGQTPAEFAGRRGRLRAEAGGAVVLVRAPDESDEDERARFRTGNSIMYLAGVESPRAVLAILPEGDPTGQREILFLPRRSPGFSVWQNPYPGPGADTERLTGMAATRPLDDLWDVLGPSIKKAHRVCLEGPAGDAARNTQNAALEERLRTIDPEVKVEGTLARLIAPLRWRKTAGEVANMRTAIAATLDAQRSAARAIRPGVTELAVEGTILDAFRRGLAPREAFPCIVGSGPNSIILHHVSGERSMRSGDTVVVDIGAEYNYYAADITRTFPASGHFTPRQRQLYQLVLDAQRACEKAASEKGASLRDIQGAAQETFRRSRLRARDSSGTSQTLDRFFVHGVSHWVGMDVHDVGGGSGRLEPGVVFTIEPGLYIPSEGTGIRIEDDYLFTEHGPEKLSGNLPSDPGRIEAIMRGGAHSLTRMTCVALRPGEFAR